MSTRVAVALTLDSMRRRFEDNCADFNDAVRDRRVALYVND